MSIAEKITRKIMTGFVLSKYVSSIPKNGILKIFTDAECLHIFQNINHDNIVAYVLIDESKTPFDYVNVVMHGSRFDKKNVSIRINYINSSDEMLYQIRSFFAYDENNYGIIASKNATFERVLRDMRAKNALFYSAK